MMKLHSCADFREQATKLRPPSRPVVRQSNSYFGTGPICFSIWGRGVVPTPLPQARRHRFGGSRCPTTRCTLWRRSFPLVLFGRSPMLGRGSGAFADLRHVIYPSTLAVFERSVTERM